MVKIWLFFDFLAIFGYFCKCSSGHPGGRFQEAQQELYRSLYGREDTPPRGKFCVAYSNGNLGNSVGALFVKKYFDERSKADVSLTIKPRLCKKNPRLCQEFLTDENASSKI